jgi:outer membrane lipoprotein SlyB
LDAVLGGIQGVAGEFGAVEGATARFGIESKELQKTMVQLVILRRRGQIPAQEQTNFSDLK